MSDRLLPFEGVYNFRDFGGYATTDGRRVRRGWLYRSAHLARATDADAARLRSLDIGVVVDLRRRGERDAEPSSCWPQDAPPRFILSDLGETSALPPHLVFLKETGEISAQAVRDYMISTYRRIPAEDRHREMFAAVFGALAAGEGPMLVHCAAGKDRTGVLCALVLHALGVSRDDIFEDYELTNRSGAIDGVLMQAAARFSKKLERHVTADQLRPMITVDPAYLEAAFSALDETHGSAEAYLAKVLGVDDAAREAMRAHLVEMAEEAA